MISDWFADGSGSLVPEELLNIQHSLNDVQKLRGGV